MSEHPDQTDLQDVYRLQQPELKKRCQSARSPS